MKALLAAMLLWGLLWEFREPLHDWVARPWRALEHDPLPGLVWRHGREEPALRGQADFERWVRAVRLQDRRFRPDLGQAIERELADWVRQFPDEEERLRRLRLAGLGGGELERRIREHLLDEAWLERRLPAEPAAEVIQRHVPPAPKVLRLAHLFLSRHREGQSDRSGEMRDLERRLRQGAVWQDLVTAHSEDERSKSRAGDLGWVTAGRFPTELWQVASGLKPGEFSRPVESPLGWHLLRLLDQKPGREPGAEEGGAEVASRLQWQARSQVLDRLRREADRATRLK